jgi:hypothetical protein
LGSADAPLAGLKDGQKNETKHFSKKIYRVCTHLAPFFLFLFLFFFKKKFVSLVEKKNLNFKLGEYCVGVAKYPITTY